MADDRIQVTIPFYGDVRLLHEAVESVLAQDDPGWLLTVVEDGDHGAGVAGWLADLHDDRVEHVLNHRRLGVTGNFQRCLELGRTDLITFLGYDDRLLPGYVTQVRGVLHELPGAAAVLPGVDVIDEVGREVAPVTDRVKNVLAKASVSAGTPTISGDRALASLLHGNWAYFPAVCWRRELIARVGFRQDLPTTLDLALLASLLLDGRELAVAPRPVVFQYRRHAGSASSLTASQLTRFAEEQRLFTEVRSAAAAHGFRRSTRAARWHLASRLHAATMLPTSLKTRDVDGLRSIAGHALGR